ncbi:MAG: DUF349 domain-containing protein, partial [Lentimicrobiaceae bacterium]|nr:DUF349 domain-containing protein [Lentimicrobiaceae bacterium]
MDDLQGQMPTETTEQRFENEQFVNAEQPVASLQGAGELRAEFGSQTEEDCQSEENGKMEEKSRNESAEAEKSVEKEEKTTSDEVSPRKNLDKNHNKPQEETDIEAVGVEIADDFYDHLTREEVVKTLEEIVVEKDIVKIKKQISLLKIRFLQLNKENREERLQSFLAGGGNKEDYDYSADELEVRFEKSFDRYRANKAKYTEDLEQLKTVNLEKKYALLDELKTLIESSTDSLKQIHDKFKDIQAIWKEIGPVPQANITELWQNYHFYVEKFFDKVKINRELRDLDLKKNLERKIEICEKTESLMFETSIIRAFHQLQQYHQEWKEAGPIEEEKKEELWNRFKTASDKINQNRKEYYEQLDKQQDENYKAKLMLCDKIEAITSVEFVSSKQVSKIGDEVAVLFEAWKSLGAVPKEVQTEVWERFRKALDVFYTTKKQYMSQVKDEQENSYNVKLNLCMQAESIASRTDWAKAAKEMVELQKEWKETGSVLRRHSETLWKRFHTACDTFFAAKKAHYKEINKNEDENLLRKEALIKSVNEYVFANSKEENFEVLKAYQREWTAIGNTPAADRDRVWNTFREAIDRRFNELKTLPYELDKAKYTEYVHEMSRHKHTKEALGQEQRT